MRPIPIVFALFVCIASAMAQSPTISPATRSGAPVSVEEVRLRMQAVINVLQREKMEVEQNYANAAGEVDVLNAKLNEEISREQELQKALNDLRMKYEPGRKPEFPAVAAPPMTTPEAAK